MDLSLTLILVSWPKAWTCLCEWFIGNSLLADLLTCKFNPSCCCAWYLHVAAALDSMLLLPLLSVPCVTLSLMVNHALTQAHEGICQGPEKGHVSV